MTKTKNRKKRMDLSVNQYTSSLNDNVTVLPILPIQMTNTTGTYLDHLNEYCLLEIFSCKSLTLMDLCSIAETCTRFKQITQRVCPKEFAIKWLRYQPRYLPQKYEFKSKNYQHLYILKEVVRIIKSFGAHLSELKIHNDLDVVRWAAKHCGDSTLRRLKFEIDGVSIDMNWLFHWLPRLGRLTLTNCELLKDVSSPDLNFHRLIELEIVYSRGCVPLLKHTFPNLERFTWFRSKVYIKYNSNNALYKFIRRHGHLKAIAVHDQSVSSKWLLNVIESSCKELEELAGGEWMSPKLWFDFSTLGFVAKLKTLDLNLRYPKYPCMTYTTLLQALKSVKRIKISCMCDAAVSLQIFDILSQLRNLRELHFSYCVLNNRIPWKLLPQLRKVRLSVKGEILLNIIRDLTNLEEIECQVESKSEIYYYLSEECFLEIVKIVEQREHVLTLKSRCKFVFDKNCDKNRKVKLIKLNEY